MSSDSSAMPNVKKGEAFDISKDDIIPKLRCKYTGERGYQYA